jgi:endonuclease G
MPKDYARTGFEQGHMCNSKDRTVTTNANSATFLMSNMVPQSPRNNEQTWKNLEDYCRRLALSSKSNEVYIICGPVGKGGVGGKGRRETLEARRKEGRSGTITVPSCTWKVALVLPHGKSSPADVTTNTMTIAVCVPNTQTVTTDWTAYITTVNDIEKLTGLTLFSAIDPTVASVIKKQQYGPKVNYRVRGSGLGAETPR